jgi:hypothetical protein
MNSNELGCSIEYIGIISGRDASCHLFSVIFLIFDILYNKYLFNIYYTLYVCNERGNCIYIHSKVIREELSQFCIGTHSFHG